MGGGVAGLSCACDLVDAGLHVTLLESKRHLGGRAYSFRDKESGMMVDNCQHVLLGCCEASIGFLEKIDSVRNVRFSETTTIIGSDNKVLHVEASRLPLPFHLAPSVLRSNYLTASEKMQFARALIALPNNPPEKSCSAKEYLRMLKCSDRVIKRLVEPILISALNETAANASAESLRMLLMKAFMESRDGYKIGVPNAPLAGILEKPATRYLANRGCEIRLETRAAHIDVSHSQIRSLTLDGGASISGDFYVMAVPPWSLQQMGFEHYGGDLRWRSIVSVHLFLDFIDEDFDRACVEGEPFGWVFNKTGDFRLDFGCLQAVASAADDIVDKSKRELVELALKSAQKASPAVSKANLNHALVYRSPRATFSTNNFASARPSSTTHLCNMFLAGDWTDTGWPATIESAVLSGRSAAQAVMAAT